MIIIWDFGLNLNRCPFKVKGPLKLLLQSLYFFFILDLGDSSPRSPSHRDTVISIQYFNHFIIRRFYYDNNVEFSAVQMI